MWPKITPASEPSQAIHSRLRTSEAIAKGLTRAPRCCTNAGGRGAAANAAGAGVMSAVSRSSSDPSRAA